MEARDLRIGNRVLYKGEEVIVTSVGEYGIQAKQGDVVINAKFSTPDITGIPITEEWLKRMVFEKGKGDCMAEFLKTVIWTHESGVTLFDNQPIYSIYRYNDHKVVFRNVHQLQNAMYVFLGTELTIK